MSPVVWFHKNSVEAKKDPLIKRKIELCDNRRLVIQEGMQKKKTLSKKKKTFFFRSKIFNIIMFIGFNLYDNKRADSWMSFIDTLYVN